MEKGLRLAVYRDWLRLLERSGWSRGSHGSRRRRLKQGRVGRWLELRIAYSEGKEILDKVTITSTKYKTKKRIVQRRMGNRKSEMVD
jgi:hypothetical protein